MKTAILTVIAILVVLIIITFLLCGLIFSNLICTKPISVPDFIVRLVEKFLAGSGVPDSYPEDAARAEERLKELPFEDITLKAPDSAKLRGHVLRPRFPNGCVVIACHGARALQTRLYACPAGAQGLRYQRRKIHGIRHPRIQGYVSVA